MYKNLVFLDFCSVQHIFPGFWQCTETLFLFVSSWFHNNVKRQNKYNKTIKEREKTKHVRTEEAVSTNSPSGETAAELIVPGCPPSVRRHSPDSAFHSFAVWSVELVSTKQPSCE
jgi:hypothetical protein